MDALELLGYVKQEQSEDDWTDVYVRKGFVLMEAVETIYIRPREKSVKKFVKVFHFEPMPDYIYSSELMAVLKIMEVKIDN